MTDPTPKSPLLTRGLSRRTIVQGAAWSVPAIALAVSVPSASASVVALNVAVHAADCRIVGGSLLGLGRPPRFEIVAIGGTIPAGTTFTLRAGAGLNLGLSLNKGLKVDFDLLGSGDTRTLTLKRPIPAGSKRAVNFLNNVIDVGINKHATLSLASLPSGYTDSDPTDNAIRMSWTGVAVAPPLVEVNSCTANRP